MLTIYKSFIRPHLDYGDIVYDQPSNDAFSNKLETVRYNAALAIMRAVKGTSREKLYQELGLEYLHQRRWMRRFCLFYKVVSTKLTAFIYDTIPPVSQSQRHPNTFNSISCRTEYFKNSFLPYVIGEWNILIFIRPSASKVYIINVAIDIKLITRLRLGFSHLHEH